jgi:hypothetical protein
MKVIVKFHDDCRSDLRAWLERLPGSAEDRHLLLGSGIESMKKELARTVGYPHQAKFLSEPPPPSYWWKFTSDCWARYIITDTRHFFGRRTRVLEIIALRPTGPS